jgi:ABC-type microcin C transport system duplicated ATPase subunit YejF
MRRRAAEALAEIGVDVPSVELVVGALSGGQRQAIAWRVQSIRKRASFCLTNRSRRWARARRG